MQLSFPAEEDHKENREREGCPWGFALSLGLHQ